MIKDRIIHLLEVKRAKTEETFKALGTTSANFRGRAKETPVNSDIVERLFEMFPDVNLEWLITGEGQMFKQPTPKDMVSLERYTDMVRENERLRILKSEKTMNDNKKNDVAFNKMALLSEAIHGVQDEYEEDEDEYDELKASAFEVLLLNPGCDLGEWTRILVQEYPSEVVDAYGCNPPETMALLSDLWDAPYEDTASGLEYTFETWAQCFCNEAAVQMYYDFIETMKNVSAM